MRPLISTALVALALAACGCNANTTDVSGKVTFKGKPVVYGTVVIVGSDGTPKSGAIQPDGSYRVADVALGPAKVAVTSPRPPGGEQARKQGRDSDGDVDDKPTPAPTPAAPPEVIKNWFALPEKYGDPSRSELTAAVKRGEPLDLELK
jgi:hypothetical protein